MSGSPWQELGTLVDVTLAVVDDLPSGEGWWCPIERVVLLDAGLDRVGRRCVLAHELQHVLAGDPLPSGPDARRLHRRRERAADRGAALFLVSPAQLRDAIAWLVPLDLDGAQQLEALADELDLDLQRTRALLAA